MRRKRWTSSVAFLVIHTLFICNAAKKDIDYISVIFARNRAFSERGSKGLETAKNTETVQPIIQTRNVKKTYKVGSVDIQALRGVDLSIMPGEMVSIIGPSGSGKSTLLNVLAGLEHVTSGEIVIAGKRLDKMSQSELIVFRQKHVGFIFQSFNLMPYYTAVENVAFPLSFRGVPRKKREALAVEALNVMGIGKHLKHKPSQMSGGQQQRVGIARALVTNPDIVFADEPTGNLDSNTSDDVMRTICEVMRSRGKTLVMVTHDPNMAMYADKIIKILDGRVVEMRKNENPTYLTPRPQRTIGDQNEDEADTAEK
jgi:putative ABC transport system ATP-binding protein